MAVSFDSHVSGIVRSVNDKGLKLEGHENWLNLSKWAVDCTLPERGQHVTCTLDKAGFLRAVSTSDGAPVLPVCGASDVPAAPSTKDRTITRLAVLKAAAEYAASKPQSCSADVLAIAASWEKWVTREDAPEDDGLTDAF
jgi:hypothetical protein